MKFMDILKGKYNVWTGTLTDTSEVRFRATIWNDKNDIEFIGNLGDLGIQIISEKNGKLDVLLPDRWLGIDVAPDLTIITDRLGRKRILSMDTIQSSIILRRYDYEIIIMEDDEDVMFINLTLIDNLFKLGDPNRIADVVDISVENIELIIKESNYNPVTRFNRDVFLETAEKMLKHTLDISMPGWNDPTKHWDE